MTVTLAENPAALNPTQPSISPLEAASTINTALRAFSDKLSVEYGSDIVDATREVMLKNTRAAHERMGYEEYGLADSPVEYVPIDGLQTRIVSSALEDMIDYGVGEDGLIESLLHPRVNGPDGKLVEVQDYEPDEESLAEIARLTKQKNAHKKVAALALGVFKNENSEISANGPKYQLARNPEYLSKVGKTVRTGGDFSGRRVFVKKRLTTLPQRLIRRRRPSPDLTDMRVNNQVPSNTTVPDKMSVSKNAEPQVRRTLPLISGVEPTRLLRSRSYTSIEQSPVRNISPGRHRRSWPRVVNDAATRPPNRTDHLSGPSSISRSPNSHRGQRRPFALTRKSGRHRKLINNL